MLNQDLLKDRGVREPTVWDKRARKRFTRGPEKQALFQAGIEGHGDKERAPTPGEQLRNRIENFPADVAQVSMGDICQ
jgi:hypothetical protein